MKNSFGNALTITLFGESHGPYIGTVLDGLAPGMTVDEENIRRMLDKRRPAGQISTARHEADEFMIASGVFQGKTTGTPLLILIPNTSQDSRDYEETRFLARPGHADYTAWEKYHGFEDYRGGGHFSGRITAALTAAGALILPALERKGIRIGTHILSLGSCEDRPFSEEEDALKKELDSLKDRDFPALDDEKSAQMTEIILKAREQKDSVGGVLETAVLGVSAGLGEPWFDSMEGLLSHMLFSIPAVKGVEFGAGFDLVNHFGSEFNDAFYTDETGRIRTRTNHNGGINGGITNGMPMVFRTAVKPTPSIEKQQETADFLKKEDREIEIRGRHDAAIIHRAAVVQTCASALVIADCLTGRFGTDYLSD